VTDAVKAALIAGAASVLTCFLTWWLTRISNRKQAVKLIRSGMNGELDKLLAIAREGGRQDGFREGVAHTLKRLGLPPTV